MHVRREKEKKNILRSRRHMRVQTIDDQFSHFKTCLLTWIFVFAYFFFLKLSVSAPPLPVAGLLLDYYKIFYP